MKRIIRGALALAVLSAVSALLSPVHAQTLGTRQITLKGGIFRPSNGDVRAVGSSWWAVGGEYALNNTDARNVNSIELLYTNKHDTVGNFGTLGVNTKYTMYSLMFNHKIRQIPVGGVALGSVFYYGAGLGLDFLHAKINDPNTGGLGDVSKNRTSGGANLFVGYEVASNFSLEAKYQIPFSKLLDRRMDGLYLLAGFNF